MHQTTGHRVKGGGISDAVAGNVEVVTEKNPDLALPVDHVLNCDRAGINVFVKINGVPTHEQQPEIFMIQGNPGYLGILLIAQINFPVRAQPGKTVLNPDAKTAVFAHYMVFLTNMRKVEITDVVVMIETDKESAVANRNISRHLRLPPGRVAAGLKKRPWPLSACADI